LALPAAEIIKSQRRKALSAMFEALVNHKSDAGCQTMQEILYPNCRSTVLGGFE